MGAEVIEQQEVSINDVADNEHVTVVATTVTQPHHSLDPISIRGKIWAFSFVFYQALLCVFMFNPQGLWWIAVVAGYISATYSIFSRRLCLVYLHFGLSCLLYMLLVFYCVTMSYAFGYYVSAGWSVMSFIFSPH
ncbi:hypothetical protein SAMD00019534_056430 [Acytostelium subglobosum LB1]|uniref:hypothetical protein n=1 Tax=Acytostelium subglobosum LB1 TaxID=1410327 RepID=UPI0006448023|nr:hypothetical protein SAMD00019534_056430 [Acytostelium subglobosum LB1]GAM22468.1 hypothetical protein SAMD00019534_056430 [Acytostelium subglobosum LB1]|eukprot:XP_012754588.1 hypothetical protein SAMD00019534_056430 [Acytostelium subglobosum LB1]